MGLYIVVESDSKARQDIQDSISSIDKQAVFKSYQNLEEFYKETTEVKFKENVQLAVIEIVNKKTLEYASEIEKFRSHVTLPELPELNKDLQILISAFDDSQVQHKALQTLKVNNFVFKPFDLLILKETVNAALNFKKRLATVELKPIKSSAEIGSLKEVDLVSVSELGFVTYSEIKLTELSVSRYFSSVFSYNKKQSIWAQLVHSFPHPTQPNCFVNQFQFYGVDNAFLMSIRKYISQQKLRKTNEYVLHLVNATSAHKLKMALVSNEIEVAKKIKEDLLHHFDNIEIEIVMYLLPEDLAKKENLQQYETVLNLGDLSAEDMAKYFSEKAKFFWLNLKLASDIERKEFANFYMDLLYAPVDKSYLYKKLKLHHPELIEKEPSSFLTVTCFEKMKSASLIKISEISEVFVSFSYVRELAPKVTREFIFITEDETNLVELPAFCHFTEPDPAEKGHYLHQFVFFGMTDHYLKQIRLWITQDYITKNQKES